MSTDAALVASGHQGTSLEGRVGVGLTGAGSGMRARAHLVTQLRASPAGSQRSCVSTLRSEAPLVLRLTRAKAPEPWAATGGDVARVSLAAGAAGPVGGDELTLDVEVGAGSSLVLCEVSSTLLLPGPHSQQSRTQVHIRVAAGSTMIWLPEPVIAAHRCDHLSYVRVHLEQGARFLMREEALLGRHGEIGGQFTQRVRVRLAGQPLYCQDLCLGTPGAQTPVVIGEHRAVGSVLVVEPTWVEHPLQVRRLAGEAAVLPLNGPASLVTALGSDNLQLRGRLNAGLAALGPPWDAI